MVAESTNRHIVSGLPMNWEPLENLFGHNPINDDWYRPIRHLKYQEQSGGAHIYQRKLFALALATGAIGSHRCPYTSDIRASLLAAVVEISTSEVVIVDWEASWQSPQEAVEWQLFNQLPPTFSLTPLDPLFLALSQEMFGFYPEQFGDGYDKHWEEDACPFIEIWDESSLPFIDRASYSRAQGVIRQQVLDCGQVCLTILPQQVRDSIARVGQVVPKYLQAAIQHRLEKNKRDGY